MQQESVYNNWETAEDNISVSENDILRLPQY